MPLEEEANLGRQRRDAEQSHVLHDVVEIEQRHRRQRPPPLLETTRQIGPVEDVHRRPLQRGHAARETTALQFDGQDVGHPSSQERSRRCHRNELTATEHHELRFRAREEVEPLRHALRVPVGLERAVVCEYGVGSEAAGDEQEIDRTLGRRLSQARHEKHPPFHAAKPARAEITLEARVDGNGRHRSISQTSGEFRAREDGVCREEVEDVHLTIPSDTGHI